MNTQKLITPVRQIIAQIHLLNSNIQFKEITMVISNLNYSNNPKMYYFLLHLE